MYLKTIKLIALIITLSAIGVSAQTVTNSPYSRYGIGDLSIMGDSHNMAMGGTSVAESTPYYINMVNPACLTNFNMQRFIFDVGMNVKYTNTSSNAASQKNCNSTFSYLAGGFAAKPWWYFSFQLRPMSSVGYQFSDTAKVAYDDEKSVFSESFNGKGGLNKLSIATAFKFWKVLSVGATGSVLFGNLERYHSVQNLKNNGYPDGYSSTLTNNISYSDKFIMHGLQYDLGIRLEKRWRSRKDTLTEAFRLSLGAYVGGDSEIKCRNELFLNSYHYTSSGNNKYSYQAYSDTVACDTSFRGRLAIPGGFGVGLSMEIMQQLTFNADYHYQDWSKFALPGHSESSNMREMKYMALGMQYVYDKYSSRFLRTINYRVGLHKQETYLQINGHGISEKGVSLGLGIPLRTLLLNVGVNIGKRGTTEHNLYEEKYFLINMGVTAHDIWFVKRKFQ